MSDTILYLLLGTTEPDEIENAEVQPFVMIFLEPFNLFKYPISVNQTV